MQRHQLIPFATDDDLAAAAAGRWLSQLAADPGKPFCVALSGGRIARKFFASAAQAAGLRRALLAPVHFFWADERCVPPGDPESNFGLARDHFLEPLGISPDRIHRIRGEIAPERAAAEAEAEICRVAPMSPLGHPQLDVIFLGMGEDGHVASLFPGAPEPGVAAAEEPVYRPVTASKPPPRRITITLPAIAAARQVWVLASGPGKSQALRASLAPEGATPLARVLQSRPETLLFTDIPISTASA